jgi:hypothetical protein
MSQLLQRGADSFDCQRGAANMMAADVITGGCDVTVMSATAGGSDDDLS